MRNKTKATFLFTVKLDCLVDFCLLRCVNVATMPRICKITYSYKLNSAEFSEQ